MRVTMLGCGGSMGVPLIGNDWGNCDPTDPRNRRRRCSILVETARTRVLVDTSPDLREQLLETGTDTLDAVLYTHAHADHTGGLDDLRPLMFRNHNPLPAYMDAATQDSLETRFGYALSSVDVDRSFYRPIIEPRRLNGPLRIGERHAPAKELRQHRALALVHVIEQVVGEIAAHADQFRPVRRFHDAGKRRHHRRLVGRGEHLGHRARLLQADFEAGHHLPDELADKAAIDRPLVLEILVERRPGHAGLACDVVHGAALEAVAREHGEGRVEDRALASVLRPAACFACHRHARPYALLNRALRIHTCVHGRSRFAKSARYILTLFHKM